MKIKLRFFSHSGQQVVVVRSYQLAQKKAALQYKAMDQTIQTYDQARIKSATSHRCAEMDRIVPEMIGASKAVLENVVFVHQEDSNWPLADTQTLKKRCAVRGGGWDGGVGAGALPAAGRVARRPSTNSPPRPFPFQL